MNSKYITLIEKIIKMAHAGKIKWELTGLYDTFITRLPNGAISITLNDLPIHGIGNYAEMTLFDTSGTEIDSVKCPTKDSADTKLLTQLYDVARQSYYKIDQTIDSLISDLDSL